MALTKKTPETIKASLSHKAMGVENTIQLTYFNHKHKAYEEWVKNPENLKIPETVESDVKGINYLNASLVLFLVKSFDDATGEDFPLTHAGLLDLEAEWPGSLLGIISCYHKARGAAVEKN